MLGGRHLKILQDAQEAVGEVLFRWDRAPQKRPGRLRSGEARGSVSRSAKGRQCPRRWLPPTASASMG